MAHQTLDIEAQALLALKAQQGATFAAAVQCLLECRGRVVVMGMGKSGHVGGKIAATLASTGTPAFFVHPAEANHGDLGMVTAGDVVLAISNSGESDELSSILPALKRLGVKVVAMTGRAGSTLAQHADLVLSNRVEKEACPLNLAPTASTTAQLALGDALAVALMERKGFTHDHYRVFHPGGRLGKQLIKVSDLMHAGPEMPLVASGTPMRQALVTMAGRSFGCIGIVGVKGREKDRLIGIMTDGDLRRHIEGDLLAQTVDAVMTKSPITIGPQQLAVEALRLMNSRRITAFFVVEHGRPIGILHMHDCVRAGIT